MYVRRSLRIQHRKNRPNCHNERELYWKEQIVPCQHIREEFVTSCIDDPAWRIQVKQYIPKNNRTPKEADIIIVSSHGSAFPKVCPLSNLNPSFTSQTNYQKFYEPFWDNLPSCLNNKNFKIRNIFITTYPHLSPSFLNPGLTQDGSRISDSSRDLLLLVNHFRHAILHPIIGVGQSVGASQLASLSLIPSEARSQDRISV
jgi:hypothetical protein